MWEVTALCHLGRHPSGLGAGAAPMDPVVMELFGEQLCRIKDKHHYRASASKAVNMFSLYQRTLFSGSRTLHKEVLLWRGMPAGNRLKQRRNIFHP